MGVGAGRRRRRRLAGGESVSMFKPRREVNRGSRRAALGERGAARRPRECCSEGGEEEEEARGEWGGRGEERGEAGRQRAAPTVEFSLNSLHLPAGGW